MCLAWRAFDSATWDHCDVRFEKDVDDLGGMMTATNEDYYEEGSIDFSATAQMEELAGEFNVSKDEQSLDANLDDW